MLTNALAKGLLTLIFSFSKNCKITFLRYCRFTASSSSPTFEFELRLVLLALVGVLGASDGTGDAVRRGDKAPFPLVKRLG